MGEGDLHLENALFLRCRARSNASIENKVVRGELLRATSRYIDKNNHDFFILKRQSRLFMSSPHLFYLLTYYWPHLLC